MIKQNTLIRLLEVHGYGIEKKYGCLLVISKGNVQTYLPTQLLYSWLRLRIMLELNRELSISTPRIEILQWKLHLAVIKESNKK